MGLGVIRLVLAFMVFLNHLWLPTANVLGAHAVTGFYVISGFLMTKVVNEVYLGRGGRIRYFANRVLRIYPLYLLALLATVGGLTIWPNYFATYSLIRIPSSVGEWFSNLTLFRLTDSPTILIPPAWSLFVELVFYAVIAILARSRMLVIVWLVFSLIYTAWMVANDLPFRDRYYPLTAASLFFSMGAASYFFTSCMPRENLLQKVPMMIVWCFALLFVIFPILVEEMGGAKTMLGYYGASGIFVVVFLCLVLKGKLNGGDWDRLLGDLAYPIFLLHFFAAGIVNLMTANRYPGTGTVHMLISAGVCLALSLAFIKYVEPVFEMIRARIRSTDIKRRLS